MDEEVELAKVTELGRRRGEERGEVIALDSVEAETVDPKRSASSTEHSLDGVASGALLLQGSSPYEGANRRSHDRMLVEEVVTVR